MGVAAPSGDRYTFGRAGHCPLDVTPTGRMQLPAASGRWALSRRSGKLCA